MRRQAFDALTDPRDSADTAPMPNVISAPVEWIKSVGALRLPPRADARLQQLMDRNTEGLLPKTEREEMAALVELSQRLSLLRAEALSLLGQHP